MRLDSGGDIEWQNGYFFGGYDAKSIEQTSDGGFVTALFGDDFTIARDTMADGDIAPWNNPDGSVDADTFVLALPMVERQQLAVGQMALSLASRSAQRPTSKTHGSNLLDRGVES